eukprot:UN10699
MRHPKPWEAHPTKNVKLKTTQRRLGRYLPNSTLEIYLQMFIKLIQMCSALDSSVCHRDAT